MSETSFSGPKPDLLLSANLAQLQSSRRPDAPDADYALALRLDLMARIVAKRLGEHIEQAGFVVMGVSAASRGWATHAEPILRGVSRGDRATE
jgi:hypothetical protein